MDRFNTHVISAILNIGQQVEEAWPLYIKDNDGRSHEVILAPGQRMKRNEEDLNKTHDTSNQIVKESYSAYISDD